MAIDYMDSDVERHKEQQLGRRFEKENAEIDLYFYDGLGLWHNHSCSGTSCCCSACDLLSDPSYWWDRKEN